MSKIKITINDQEIESLDQAIKLIQEAKEKEKKGLWRPEDNGRYYVIVTSENERRDNYVEKRSNYIQEITDKDWMVGNCFRTESEAQTELDKRKALVRIKDYIAREFGECTPEWKSGEDKWVVGYDCDNDNFFTELATYNRGFIIAVKEKSNAEQLIEACESDLKILFEV